MHLKWKTAGFFLKRRKVWGCGVVSNRFGELCSRQVITDASKSYDDDDDSSCKVLVFSDKEVRNFSRPEKIGRILLNFVRRDWTWVEISFFKLEKQKHLDCLHCTNQGFVKKVGHFSLLQWIRLSSGDHNRWDNWPGSKYHICDVIALAMYLHCDVIKASLVQTWFANFF